MIQDINIMVRIHNYSFHFFPRLLVAKVDGLAKIARKKK